MYEQYMLGKDYLKEAVPAMKTIAGAREYILKQGAGTSLEVVELYTGSGFSIHIYPQRGMDIGEAYFCGVPLAFVSKAGIRHPGEIETGSFSRYFFGGLLTTCGLDNVGGACEVNGQFYPGHGRLNLTPAEQYQIRQYQDGADYIIEFSGTVRLAVLFGENLVLKRRIWIKAGESRFYLHDQIVNEGYQKAAYMLLYHCNFGYPVVSEDSFICTNFRKVEYLDEQSEKFAREHDKLMKPQPGFQQSAYVLSEPREPRIRAEIINKELALGVYLEANHEQLDKFCEWMNLASQDYAIGLEPAKTLPIGRDQAEAEDEMVWIEPHAVHETELELGIIDSFQ